MAATDDGLRLIGLASDAIAAGARADVALGVAQQGRAAEIDSGRFPAAIIPTRAAGINPPTPRPEGLVAEGLIKALEV